VWALPDTEQKHNLFHSGLETLSDYGYVARTGYFVWNREQERYRVGRKPRANEVPLFWAHNVKPGILCRPYDGDPQARQIGFVKINRDSTAIIRRDAIILQRTSNRRQKRRLIAAVARQSKVPGGRGFVGENHTIIVIRDPKKKATVTLSVLCQLLNTAAVDSRFRRISGSVSVSTKALNQLPLPAVEQVRSRFVRGCEDELAAQLCYAESLKSTKVWSETRAGG
jgi:adenine-specific DNA-methyltransferase